MRAEDQQSRIVWNVFGPGLLTGLVALSAILGGCAAMDTGQLRGGSGPVAWEVTNIGQITSADQRRIRWSYTIVLRETAGSAVRFERLEQGMYAPGTDIVNRTLRADPLDRRLEPGGELRLNYVDSWGWGRSTSVPFGGTAQLGGITVERRYIGTTARGDTVNVTIRVYLDRGVGKLGRQPRTDPLPPARDLQPDELKTLAGTWLGHYKWGEYDIPTEVIVREDGSLEIGENDPVTNRFRGTLRIVAGKLAYSAGRDSGTLTLHEAQGKRVAVGQITSTPSSGQTTRYPIRIELVRP